MSCKTCGSPYHNTTYNIHTCSLKYCLESDPIEFKQAVFDVAKFIGVCIFALAVLIAGNKWL